jgi:hypothetical protein
VESVTVNAAPREAAGLLAGEQVVIAGITNVAAAPVG